jgi:Helix-turn-helix domain/Domain of unknown function (DUF4115)
VGAFGEKLRQQREQKGISLDAISTTTKISTRMLRAIEDEHFDQLPGGVFNKGFVRAYARHVGLDEEEAVSDYLAALRESQIQAQAILPAFRVNGNSSTVDVVRSQPVKTSTETITRARSVVQPQASQRKRSDRKQDRREARAVEIRAVEEPPDIPPRPLSFLNLSDEAHEGAGQLEPLPQLPLPANPSAHFPWERLAAALLAITLVFAFWSLYRHARSGNNAAVAANQAPAPIATPASTISDVPNTTPKPPVVPASATNLMNPPSTPTPSGRDVKPSATTPIVHAVKPKPPSKFTLQIKASKTSWISIMADGQSVAKETLIAPANTSVRAEHEIVVRTGNAAAINFFLNGKDIPANGNEGEVRVYTFDASGLQSSALAQPTNPAN